MNCNFCGKANANKRCSGCHCAHYCNETCQRDHWGVHKGPCKATQAALLRCGSCEALLGDTGSLCGACKRAGYCSKKCQTAAWPAHKAACKAWDRAAADDAAASAAARRSRAQLHARLAEYEAMSLEHSHIMHMPAVHIAAANGDAEAVSALVAHSRHNVSCRVYDGDTPLHQTGTGSFPDIGTEGHAAAASALLAAGAAVDALDNSGITPLACAAFTGATHVIRVLLAAGADPRLADRRGRTPYAKARDQGHAECARLLMEAELARGAA